MKILITNDDGIYSEGIYSLIKEFEKDNEVFVAAPDNQRSASGHSITLGRPIIVKEVKLEGVSSKTYSVYGTPADCVKIAVEKLYSGKFDIVLSGINYGTNLGSDVIYSGTVSAAIEGSIYKIPSFAVSAGIGDGIINYELASEYTRRIVETALKNYVSDDIVININVPPVREQEIKGIKVSELGNRIYTNCYIETQLENNETGYKLEGWPTDIDRENTDIYNYKNGYITVTPLHYDLTNFKLLKEVGNWFNVY